MRQVRSAVPAHRAENRAAADEKAVEALTAEVKAGDAGDRSKLLPVAHRQRAEAAQRDLVQATDADR